MRGIGRWISVMVCALMIVACGSTQSTESAGEFFDSSAVTTRVKASLIDELGSSGFAIQVKTFKDEVQLSGFVSTQDVRRRAAIIAAGVGGVKRVRNAIIVK
jgi:osmotically-inducible protein OsmY